MLSLDRDIAIVIHGQNGIADHERITVFSDAILRVAKTALIEIRLQVRTGYGAEFLPTEVLSLVLDKFSIINILVVTNIVIVIGSPIWGVVYIGGRLLGYRGGDSGFRLRRSRRLFIRVYRGCVDDGGW